MYRPPVDLTVIKAVKDAVLIPEIGNGEVMRPSDALEMLEKTGCDALMIARGALGNPFIFAQIKAALHGQTPKTVSRIERLQTAKEHLSLLVADKGEAQGLWEARKHIAWYIKGMPGAPKMRDAVNRCNDLKEMYEMLDRAIEYV